LSPAALDDAYRLLDASVMRYRGRPVGTAAAGDPQGLAADNYRDCFIRDFMVSGLVFLADGKIDIVRSFLLAYLEVTPSGSTTCRSARFIRPSCRRAFAFNATPAPGSG
jgi:hypothetical protein